MIKFRSIALALTVLVLIFQSACSPGSAWRKNSLHEVSFETPGELHEEKIELPAEYLKYIDEYKTYLLEKGNLVVFFMVVNSRFEGYDKQVGLSNSIGNMVSVIKGTDLTLEYEEPANDLDDLTATGTFSQNGTTIHVKGYVYWNKNGKFFILTTFGHSEDRESMDRIHRSVTAGF